MCIGMLSRGVGVPVAGFDVEGLSAFFGRVLNSGWPEAWLEPGSLCARCYVYRHIVIRSLGWLCFVYDYNQTGANLYVERAPTALLPSEYVITSFGIYMHGQPHT